MRRPTRPAARLAVGLAAATALLACAHAPSANAPALEDAFADLRALRDQLDVAEGRGVETDTTGAPLATTRAAYRRARAAVARRLAGAPASPARDAMRAALTSALPADEPPQAAAEPSCAYDAAALAAEGLAALAGRIYACYGRAAQAVRVGGETLDRLTVLGRLAETTDPAARRDLFLALDPVWRTMNGDDGPGSPYRRLLPLSAAAWRSEGSPLTHNAAALGVAAEQVEPWLVSILEVWRDATAGEELEPWDWHYGAGALARALAAQIPRQRLEPVHDAFYAALGADPRALPIRYDLAPRAGKTPVAYTTFGRRPRVRRDGRVEPGEAWVFATYRRGGFDNLVELLHETGHAIHILAIRTAPAFADWPDSDTYTEALGDLLALDAYEPAWQRRFLGAEAPLADGLRAKYASIVLDVAWALFEIRMHREPAGDPNRVWADLTHDYLHVARHPELSWWAMRGQLVDAPGYMLNYALGAIVVADLRARCRELRGPFAAADAGTYAWLADRLYRFGLERSSRAVVEEFLGRPLRPDALLADLRRLQPKAFLAGGEQRPRAQP